MSSNVFEQICSNLDISLSVSVVTTNHIKAILVAIFFIILLAQKEIQI